MRTLVPKKGALSVKSMLPIAAKPSSGKLLGGFFETPAVVCCHGIGPRQVHSREEPWDVLSRQKPLGQMKQPGDMEQSGASRYSVASCGNPG